MSQFSDIIHQPQQKLQKNSFTS